MKRIGAWLCCLGCAAGLGAAGVAAETEALIARLTEEAQLSEMLRSVRSMSRAMTEFAHMIGGVAGRKNVIFLSEGFDPTVLQGTTNDAVRREQSEQAASGEIWKYSSETMYGNTRNTARSEIEKTISAASLLLGAEEGGPIRTELLTVPSPGEGGKARVPVVVEVDGPSLLAGTAEGKLPAEIYV